MKLKSRDALVRNSVRVSEAADHVCALTSSGGGGAVAVSLLILRISQNVWCTSVPGCNSISISISKRSIAPYFLLLLRPPGPPHPPPLAVRAGCCLHKSFPAPFPLVPNSNPVHPGPGPSQQVSSKAVLVAMAMTSSKPHIVGTRNSCNYIFQQPPTPAL